jgi:(hydroxyamino)benzene mutase
MTDASLSELPRHPLDPDPARSTKATAVLALGVVSALTGALVGGVVPAAVALLLAREARTDILAAKGFLVGTRRLRTGVALAWVGIVFAAAALVTASIIGLLHFAQPGGPDFRPTVN